MALCSDVENFSVALAPETEAAQTVKQIVRTDDYCSLLRGTVAVSSLGASACTYASWSRLPKGPKMISFILPISMRSTGVPSTDSTMSPTETLPTRTPVPAQFANVKLYGFVLARIQGRMLTIVFIHQLVDMLDDVWRPIRYLHSQPVETRRTPRCIRQSC